MNSYSLHFFVALVFAGAIAVFFSRSWRKRLIAFVIVPLCYYVVFYNYNYGLVSGVSPIVMSYVGAAYTCLLYLFFSSYRVTPVRVLVNNKELLKIFLLLGGQYVCVLYASVIPWAFDTFPMSNAEAVLFTLFAGTNDGAEEFVISSIWDKVFISSVKIFFTLLLNEVCLAFILQQINRGVEFNFGKIRYSICSNGFKANLLQLQKGVFVLLILYCCVLSLIIPGVVLSTPFRLLFQVPVDSEIYRNHFVYPDSMQLNLPKKARNLIVIMVESMETNFERYTPEIVELQRQNTNFIPGGVSVSGTSWTIAGIMGKLCGIPLNMPIGPNEYLGKLPTYLPGATCLMDILEKENYNQVYMQGSSGDFTQKRKFWMVHGNVDVHDIEYYKKVGKISEKYNVFWGFEDRKLYHFAKQELNVLSEMEYPFALYMLTVDTHQPEGYLDPQCAKDFVGVEGNFPKVLRCASKQLGDFLNWVKLQPWYENTVISIMGDHTMRTLSLKAGVPVSDSLYWTNFIINSAVTTPVRERRYSSLDMFPTLLESMGFNLKNHSAGLGRSLYSDSLTMLELYGRKTLDSLLRERSIQYDKFLMKKNE